MTDDGALSLAELEGGFDEREGTVKYIRIYSDPVGESHFEDVETQFDPVDFAPPAPPVQTAIPMPAEQVVLVTLPPGFYADWHPAPRRQLFLQLSGQIEVGVSDGETRRFGAGTVVLGEDLSGKGHTVRVLSTADALGAIVQLA
jgi:hypothetical protein